MRYLFPIGVVLITAAFILSCSGLPGDKHSRVVDPDRAWTSDTTAYVIDTVAGMRSTLQDAIDLCTDGDTLILTSGIYQAPPNEFIDSLCGNCLEQKTEVYASTGFEIKNKSIVIIGAGKDSTILVSGAGYGVYFENSRQSRLMRLMLTGGIRDLDGNATDAAVVVRTSRVYIDNCAMADNTHRRDSVVVGIGGVFGREGAEIFISNCDIVNNGWDGMALYRGATAVITDCVIRQGRGAGIGVTWDADCMALRNDISEYWKGIGSFGTSNVIAHNNLVHDNLGWGIIATGESYMDATNNVVNHNGNCGVAPWSQECSGRFVNNIITNNGWRKEWVCPCVGVWNYGDLKRWRFFKIRCLSGTETIIYSRVRPPSTPATRKSPTATVPRRI